jgi:hypothetical protein
VSFNVRKRVSTPTHGGQKTVYSTVFMQMYEVRLISIVHRKGKMNMHVGKYVCIVWESIMLRTCAVHGERMEEGQRAHWR